MTQTRQVGRKRVQPRTSEVILARNEGPVAIFLPHPGIIGKICYRLFASPRRREGARKIFCQIGSMRCAVARQRKSLSIEISRRYPLGELPGAPTGPTAGVPPVLKMAPPST